VLDWRDADAFRRVNGAERSEYIEERRAVLPRNAPLENVEELRHVMGVTDALFSRIRPHVTTEGSGRINFTTAAAPVLAATPGMSDEAVAVVLRHRATRRPVRSAQQLQEQLSPAARQLMERELPRFLSTVIFDTREVAVMSTGWVDGSPVRVRSTAVLVRGGSAAIMTWRYSE
jgi:type II secretory pathway component PulK